ncbi:MAG: GTP-binding protein [Alphaproteobacteria bacterium]|nr:GTP-binding protein [Alphaproteobacteria bacterium]
MPERPQCALPVVTIGGFLGAGKTTLVNAILRRADGRRIVVFVNDFGAINIDHALVETVEQDRISLKNGCVCCSLNDDLVAGVAQFARSDAAPDAVVIECSGVADPRALDASLDALEAAGLARLCTRLYLLDVACFDSLPFEDSEHIIDHAAASDVLLLNKTDLASAEQVAAIRQTLEVAAPYSAILETQQAAIPPDIIFDDHSRDHRPTDFPSTDDRRDNHWGERYVQWSGQTEEPLDRRRFEEFARSLPKQCVRAKGLLRFSDDPQSTVLFNLVGHRATLDMSNGPSTQSASLIVAIGEKGMLDAAHMEASFLALLSPELTTELKHCRKPDIRSAPRTNHQLSRDQGRSNSASDGTSPKLDSISRSMAFRVTRLCWRE